MYLTREQEAMLRGDYGWSTAKALEIVIKVGESMGADRLISIVHAHVSGISFSNIGIYGARFIREFYEKGGRARVYTTVNPGCIDYGGLQEVIDNSLLEQQRGIDDALVKMGFKPVFTCIPYWYRPPQAFEHLAWGESSAVIFANSFHGGFTNREGGPIALAAAITGYTYNAGLHLLENRVAKTIVEVPLEAQRYPTGALGLWIGENVRSIPLIPSARHMGIPRLKILLASMAASGSHAMAVIPGLTPHGTYATDIEEKVVVEPGDLEKYIGESPAATSSILGYVGCPHLTLGELFELLRLLRRYARPRRGRLLVTIPVEYVHRYSNVVYALRTRGVHIAAGTCPVVSRLREKYDFIVTNSGKSAFYLRKIHGLRVTIMELGDVVRYIYGH